VTDEGVPAGPGELIESASWLDGAIRFERCRWRCVQASRRSADVASHRLVLIERGGSKRTTIRLDGTQLYRGRDWPQALSFAPAGIERHGTYVGVDLTYCVLRISPALEKDLLEGGRTLARSPRINVRDPLVGCLLGELGKDLSAGEPPTTAYLEHLIALVRYRLSGLPLQGAEDGRNRPLEAQLITRVDEYIRAHLGEDISVSTLAVLCGMRPDTFARQFRAATGKAPYAYALACRIEHAQRLLRTGASDLTTLAVNLGFASQSHFTTAFRRAVGVTPGSYRALHRPKS
jgi:AraC family transcriptional regulator